MRMIKLGAIFMGVVSGCASRIAPTPASTTADAHVAGIHRSKCGSCHAPVAPGSLPRAELESAMQRHRRRAKLSEREWADMVEFLSSRSAAPMFGSEH